MYVRISNTSFKKAYYKTYKLMIMYRHFNIKFSNNIQYKYNDLTSSLFNLECSYIMSLNIR